MGIICINYLNFFCKGRLSIIPTLFNCLCVCVCVGTSLLIDTIRYSRLSLHVPTSRLSYFSREPWFLWLEHGIRNQDLGVRCAHGSRGIAFFDERTRKCMCTHTTYESVFIDTNRSINISICTHLYETIHELMLSPTLTHSLWIILAVSLAYM